MSTYSEEPLIARRSSRSREQRCHLPRTKRVGHVHCPVRRSGRSRAQQHGRHARAGVPAGADGSRSRAPMRQSGAPRELGMVPGIFGDAWSCSLRAEFRKQQEQGRFGRSRVVERLKMRRGVKVSPAERDCGRWFWRRRTCTSAPRSLLVGMC